MMTAQPKSFDAFIEEHDIKLTVKQWFSLQGGNLRAQVDKLILQGASPSRLYDWLVQEYQYPLSRSSMIRYSTALKLAA